MLDLSGIFEDMEKDSIAKLTKKINKQAEIIVERNNILRRENAHLRSEHYKDDELKAMEQHIENMKTECDKRLEDYRRGFPITQNEGKQIDAWIDKHILEDHDGNSYAGAIGGMFTYHFVPTSLGTLGTVRCSCGAEFEFQEIG